ncbi:MAG TPA: hypothetical protein VGH39_09395 [Xanthobacteraceae bacterium]|jgi:hypothetical protein
MLDLRTRKISDTRTSTAPAGFCYIALAAVTLTMSTRLVFVRTPWQPIYHAIYAAYVGTIAESAIIDIDHWRHYFLILGLLWGLMAATSRYAAESRGSGINSQAAWEASGGSRDTGGCRCRAP